MEGEAVMPPEPCDDFGVLVGRVVVEHDADLLVGVDPTFATSAAK